jgi:hypothetical protein
MNEETKLPDGLQLAVKLLAQIGGDESDRAISAVHAACDLAQRVADLEAQRDSYKAAFAEWLPLAHYMRDLVRDGTAPADSLGHHCADVAIETIKRLIRQRDELRAKYDELLVALHGIGAALGIPEGDRSPYSVTCGALELVNLLAEVIRLLAEVAALKGGAA